MCVKLYYRNLNLSFSPIPYKYLYTRNLILKYAFLLYLFFNFNLFYLMVKVQSYFFSTINLSRPSYYASSIIVLVNRQICPFQNNSFGRGQKALWASMAAAMEVCHCRSVLRNVDFRGWDPNPNPLFGHQNPKIHWYQTTACVEPQRLGISEITAWTMPLL